MLKEICNIPAGRAPFLGDGIECTTIENPEAKTDDLLKKCATDGRKTFRDPTTLKASIDGMSLKNLAQYVTFPANNIWGVKGGPTRSAADTYFIFLKPLSPGKHVFTFSASSQLHLHRHLNPITNLLIH